VSINGVAVQRRVRVAACFLVASFAAVSLIATAASAREPRPGPASGRAPRVSVERSGALATRDGLKLTISADTGSVRVFSDGTGEGAGDGTREVRYAVRVEAEASDTATALVKEFSLTARSTSLGISLAGRMPALRDSESVWVTYEVHVPRRYNLEISTRAGDIATQDIDGTVALSTGGGNIEAGRVGDGGTPQARGAAGRFVARLNTAGGHIKIGDVAGGLRATTGGGHITTGNIAGEAVLHSDGGNLQAGSITGRAQLTTGGGNIVAERTGGGVIAESAGGRIEFGEATGAISARTQGGGVRIVRVAGPTELDVRDGGIVLAGVEAPLRASSGTGGITASFSQGFSGAAVLEGGSELSSGHGDIVVYLPRQIGMTIDAVIEHTAGGGRITADSSVPLKIDASGTADRVLHGQCALNGGGKVLHLRAMDGNIQLHFLDEGIQRTGATERALPGQKNLAAKPEAADNSGVAVAGGVADAVRTGNSGYSGGPDGNSARNSYRSWWHGSWWQDLWWGGVRVDPDEEQKRLSHAVAPEYPDAARQAGIEGDVTMRVVVGPDGAVNGIKLLSGNASLARAAMESVAQWHYAPTLLDGWPVSVVTTVTVAFRLH
jgi:TonB family protein